MGKLGQALVDLWEGWGTYIRVGGLSTHGETSGL
jgi:hypothetical protein